MLKCYLPAAGYSPARAFVWFSLEFFLGCLLAALGVQLAVALLAFFMTLGLGLFLLWPRKSVLLIALALLISFGWGLWRKAEQGPQSDDLSYVHSGQVTVCGRVEEVRERSGGGKHSLTLVLAARSLLWPYQAPLSGRVLVQLLISSPEIGEMARPIAIRPLPGQELELTGALECPSPRHFSFEFDEASWLARQGIYCRLQCSADPAHCRILSLESRGRGLFETTVDKLFPLLYQLLGAEAEKLRRIIVQRHNDHLGPLLGPLFSSIVMGDRVVAVDADIKKEFSRIGLSHLLAASGLNLTIIVAFALALCRRRRNCGGWLEAWMSFLCVISFVTLAGSGPSVNRAAVMCLVALWARLTFLKTQAGVTLALALLLALALEPTSVLDIGLQFSYAATFGIIYIFPLFEAFLHRISMPLLKGAASLTAVVISAQLAVLPVQLVHFQQLSLLVLPANLLAEPVVVPLTILGFISSILAASGQPQLLHAASVWSTGLLDGLASYPLHWLVWLAHTLALYPLASVSLPGPGAIHLVLYYCFLFYCLLGLKLRPALAAIFLCLSCLLLIFLSYVQSPLLEIFLTSKQLVVNQGNRHFFVCDLEKKSAVNKAADSRYITHLKHIGLPQVGAPPLVATGAVSADELVLADEGLKIVIRQRQGRVSELNVQSLQAGSCLSLYRPCTRFCRSLGRVETAYFLPNFPGLKLFSVPLWSKVEQGAGALFLRLRWL